MSIGNDEKDLIKKLSAWGPLAGLFLGIVIFAFWTFFVILLYGFFLALSDLFGTEAVSLFWSLIILTLIGSVLSVFSSLIGERKKWIVISTIIYQVVMLLLIFILETKTPYNVRTLWFWLILFIVEIALTTIVFSLTFKKTLIEEFENI